MTNSGSGEAHVSTGAVINAGCWAAREPGWRNMLSSDRLPQELPPFAIRKQGQTEDKHFSP